MEIRRAVITAAGPSQRTLPLQTLIDRDGKAKTALAIIVEEALDSGAEEICVVVYPGDADAYRAAAGQHGKRLHFVEQTKSQGYGHAVWSAREFTGSEPFLLLVGDHLYVSRGDRKCARQLVEIAASRVLRRFRRAGHARKKAALFTAPLAASSRKIARDCTMVSEVLEETHAHGSGATPDCSRFCARAIIFAFSGMHVLRRPVIRPARRGFSRRAAGQLEPCSDPVGDPRKIFGL